MKTKHLERLALGGLMALIAASLAPQAGYAATAATYVAHLYPMNSQTAGHEASGEARFTIAGDELKISIDMKGVAPDMAHWQHFHGFKDNKAATCPTAAADINHDGSVDLIETGDAAGTTMVPFNADPAAMNIPDDSYPKASANGTYHYTKTVSLKALTAAFAKAFGGPDLQLDRRVLFIHGVPPATKLPASVASLGPIPAQVTLPIACGRIERVSK